MGKAQPPKRHSKVVPLFPRPLLVPMILLISRLASTLMELMIFPHLQILSLDTASWFVHSNFVKKLQLVVATTYHHHLGHFKAVMSNEYLSWFFFQRAEISIISAYSPSSHRRCVDLTILKRAMNFNLSKQRTLGSILDTEFNHHANKCIGYATTSNAIKLKSFATEQFSSPRRSAIDQCISKRCAIDHHQSTCQCFVGLTTTPSRDLAPGCYHDRIVHTAAGAFLAFLRIGISKPSRTFSMFETIQHMTHKIRTAFGDSKASGSYSAAGDDIASWRLVEQCSTGSTPRNKRKWPSSLVCCELCHF